MKTHRNGKGNSLRNLSQNLYHFNWVPKRSIISAFWIGLILGSTYVASGEAIASGGSDTPQRFVQIAADSKEKRSAIANFDVSIEAVRSDSVWAFATPEAIEELKKEGFQVLGEFDLQVAKGGHGTAFGGFPKKDARYHDYKELTDALHQLHEKNSDITSLISIGKTIEKREIWALQINTSSEALKRNTSSKPGVIFMGNHHAREHLSAEIPLLLAEYLLKNRHHPNIRALLDKRDIWIIPMVNPDGAEYDIATGRYRMWRKNRRNNGDGSWGVDLNRNYGYMWGSGGSSKNGKSDTYRGTAPFSEPETSAIKEFIESRPNTKVLLSFHTFSELILYPWGHKYNPITDQRDRMVFETMAKTMAKWNRYKAQQSSDLYITSGDTTDWAYGELGIFAFTFELSPKSMWSGGFYPGDIIDKVFSDNLKPCMYLIEMADDPYRVLNHRPSGFLENYVQPSIPQNLMTEIHPY